jgi:transcriptional regulator with GAF, ATPase, and Fis domain
MSGHDPSETATIPRTIRASSPSFGSLRLVVESGPDQGATFSLAQARAGRLLLGTSPVCDFRLTDARASRRHAAFEMHRGRCRIVDLESTNGITIDGVEVGAALIVEGQSILIGNTSLRVMSDDAPVQPHVSEETRFGRYIGASLVMRRIYPLAERIAKADIPVIIEGETGTGKEVFAEAIHERSARAERPYVVFDCTTVAPSLLESELFGHEKGAFTGAVGVHKGVFEQAHGGTLLIDEIGDLPLQMQPKLLRAIERKEIRRVGGTDVKKVDVRVISATRRDLDHEVEAGRFRDDLFHRLAVSRIELPPLRDRVGDVLLLARSFWASCHGDPKGPPAEALARWQAASWPGNVRELRNAVIRECALGAPLPPLREHAREHGDASAPAAEGGGIRAAAQAALARGEAFPIAKRAFIEEFEQHYLEAVLAKHGGNTAAAAAEAGVARRYLQLLLAKRTR